MYILHLFVRRSTNVLPASCVHLWLSLFHAPLGRVHSAPLSSTLSLLLLDPLLSAFTLPLVSIAIGSNSVIRFVPVALGSR